MRLCAGQIQRGRKKGYMSYISIWYLVCRVSSCVQTPRWAPQLCICWPTSKECVATGRCDSWRYCVHRTRSLNSLKPTDFEALTPPENKCDSMFSFIQRTRQGSFCLCTVRDTMSPPKPAVTTGFRASLQTNTELSCIHCSCLVLYKVCWDHAAPCRMIGSTEDKSQIFCFTCCWVSQVFKMHLNQVWYYYFGTIFSRGCIHIWPCSDYLQCQHRTGCWVCSWDQVTVSKLWIKSHLITQGWRRRRTVLGQILEVNMLRMVVSSNMWSSWFRPRKWLKERMTTSLGWASSHSFISISTACQENTSSSTQCLNK